MQRSAGALLPEATFPIAHSHRGVQPGGSAPQCVGSPPGYSGQPWSPGSDAGAVCPP